MYGEKIKINKDLDIDYDDLTREVGINTRFTLQDVIRVARFSSHIPIDIMCKLMRCNYIEEYWDEIISKPFKSDGDIEYLELNWHGYTDKYGSNNYWSFSGIGKEGITPKDCSDMKFPADYRQSYAIELSPLYELSGFEIKIGKTIAIEDGEKELATGTQTINFCPSITLFEVMHWILYELSFFGSIKQRNDMVKNLHKRIDDYQEDKAKFVSLELSSEEIKERMEKKLNEKN